MQQRTALVIGATGLVGTELVRQLLQDERFAQVKTFVRKPSGIRHKNLSEHVIAFDRPNEWASLVSGDVLFSALGTTLKQAGSKEAQYTIDYTYQYQFAEAAASNAVPVYVLVSSAMANAASKLFYTRIKGELERDVKKLPFQTIHILQPGMLDGNRKEKRLGESIGLNVIRVANKLGLFKSQKPVHASIVARAMINASFDRSQPVQVHALLDVFKKAGVPV